MSEESGNPKRGVGKMLLVTYAPAHMYESGKEFDVEYRCNPGTGCQIIHNALIPASSMQEAREWVISTFGYVPTGVLSAKELELLKKKYPNYTQA